MRFATGDYGYFQEEEAQRILALMKEYGTDAAFDYYAAIRENTMVRRAAEMGNVERWFAGGIPGLSGKNELAAKIKGTVDQIEGLENHEKAVLWQAFTSSKSSKNNPYDPSVGDKVLALKEANEFGWHFEND